MLFIINLLYAVHKQVNYSQDWPLLRSHHTNNNKIADTDMSVKVLYHSI